MNLFDIYFLTVFVLFIFYLINKKYKEQKEIEKQTAYLNAELLDLLKTLNAWYLKNKKTKIVKSTYKIVSNKITSATLSNNLNDKKYVINATKWYAPEIYK